jgi:hypothetical protein
MKEKEILKLIKEMTEEEQRLYAKGNEISDEEKSTLKSLQVQLDQFWDLLRQRRARKEFGDDPDKAKLRGPGTVENYEQ